MNVADLIAILQRFPPDLRVVVDGYEGDCDDIKVVRSQPIIVFGNTTEDTESGKGKHVETDERYATANAVFIIRDGTIR